MRLRNLLLGVGGLMALLPGSTLAADGDLTEVGPSRNGAYQSLRYTLCDAKVAGQTDCGSGIDLFDRTNPMAGRGASRAFAVALDSATGCSASPVVTVVGRNFAGADAHTIATVTPNASAITVMAPAPRFVSAELANMTGCTNLTVSFILYYERGS